MAYSAEELEGMYPDIATRTNILRLAGIGQLMARSIVVPRYRIPAHLHNPLVFTEAGEKMVRELSSSRSANWGEQRIAVFLQLHHDVLFVDPNRTDISGLRDGLSKEIVDGNILHPFTWGRELYDKAYDEIPTSSLHALDSKKSIEFLRGTPRGVFQVHDTVVGPWGALQSEEFRNIPPDLRTYLYHCERPGCLRAHETRLTTSDNSIVNMRSRLSKKIFQRGTPSNWSKVLGPLEGRLVGRYDDRRSGDIVALLAECFGEVELQTIAHTALGDRSLDLRKKCAAVGISIKSAEEFLSGLSRAEIVQILLLMPDHAILHAIDSSIRCGKILIPSGEVRRPPLNSRSTGYFESSLQCSSRGVRVYSANPWTPMRRLRRLIRDVYQGSDLQSHLDWKIRQVEAESQGERLDKYLATNEVHHIVKDLFLSGPEVFRKAANGVGLVDGGSRSDAELNSDVTWKLGFPLDLDDRGASELRDNANALREAASEFSQYGEEQRRVLRSFSPNLFVALEETLDRALVFVCWLTTVDHWMEKPRFTFFRDEARRGMAQTLSSYSAKKGDPVVFNEDGVNTLFPLIAGFGLLASYLEAEAVDPEKYRRTSSEVPQVFSESDLLEFGYWSRLPFLNCPTEPRERLIQALRRVSRELSTGGISTVRNSLEHHKGSFPSQDEIFKCVDAITRICSLLEEFGILPMIFKMKGFSRDSDGRSLYSYEDYSGRGVKIPAPSSVIVTGAPQWNQNQILVPGLATGGSNWVPRFTSGVRSDFTEMWQGWPRPRLLSGNFIQVPEVMDRGESTMDPVGLPDLQ
ncbi:hypothetical protein ABZV28_23525 [Streptomyces sp. NPDC004981]|uniref:hypothetical protein n=1 Tax=Streptomyces sp. NPDC004981 TaxID=3156655 RepID=UPI0033A970D2